MQAVCTAADILKDAEVGNDYYAYYNFIRNFTPKPMATLEVRKHLVVDAIVAGLLRLKALGFSK